MQIMLGFSGEHLLILAIILLIFGPRRLPQVSHSIGKAIRNFKDGLAGVKDAQFRHVPDSNHTLNTTDDATPLQKGADLGDDTSDSPEKPEDPKAPEGPPDSKIPNELEKQDVSGQVQNNDGKQ